MGRIMPVGPVGAYKTYTGAAPLASHWRRATCEEVGCLAHANGWRTVVDERADLGLAQAAYIRQKCRAERVALAAGGAPGYRRYVETHEADLTVFTFAAGQPCFELHQVPLERTPLFLVRDGDWRGNPSGRVRRHATPADWVEDFAEHQQRVADALDHG